SKDQPKSQAASMARDVHVIVRHKNDIAWPGPVWGMGNAEPYTADQQASVRAQLLAEIEGLNLT
ncbi:MAG: hypothetical protein R6U42_11025, partial [Halomonas sp.]